MFRKTIHQWPDLAERIQGIFERRFYANHGPLESHVEQALAKVVGTEYVTAVANGSLALMFALRATAASGKVLLPAFAPPSTANAALWAGLEPVLVDVNPHTLSMDLDLAEQALSERPTALVGVHLKGVPCDTTAMAAFAQNHQMAMVFDARQAVAGRVDGEAIGRFGDATVLSFGAECLISGIEGGAVATNQEELCKRIRTMRSFHAKEKFYDDAPRMNGKISELQAAMILSSLCQLPDTLAQTRKIQQEFSHMLGNIPGIDVLSHLGDGLPVSAELLLAIDEQAFGCNAAVLCSRLEQEGIPAMTLREYDLCWTFSFLEAIKNGTGSTSTVAISLLAPACDCQPSVHDMDRVLKQLRDKPAQ